MMGNQRLEITDRWTRIARATKFKMISAVVTISVAAGLTLLLGLGFLNCSGPSATVFGGATSPPSEPANNSQNNSQNNGSLPGGLNPFIDPEVPILNLNYGGTNVVNLTQAPAAQRIYQRNDQGSASFPVEGNVSANIGAESVAVQAVRTIANQPITVVSQAIFLLDSNHHFQGNFSIPTGGSYTMLFGALDLHNNNVALSRIWPVGAGEVFLTAGGSNSTDCCGQSRQFITPEDVHFQRAIVTIAGPANPGQLSYSWTIDNVGGSPWPGFAVQLGGVLTSKNSGVEVPIMIVDLGCSASSSVDWTPNAVNLPFVGPYNSNTHQFPLTNHSCGPDADGTANTAGGLFNRLVKASRLIGNYRAILWHLGESDVANLANTQNVPGYPFPQAPGDYYNHMVSIISALNTTLGTSAPLHFVAEATYYPTNEVDGNCLTSGATGTNINYMNSVQGDQLNLVNNKYALKGPNVDALWGTIPESSPVAAYRFPGPVGLCTHFSSAGLPILGQSWSTAVISSGRF